MLCCPDINFVLYVALIKHLYSDGHITAEQASHLESKKLFEAPVTATSTIATAPAAPSTTACTTAATTNATPIASVSTSTTITVVHTCDVSATISDGAGKILMHSSTTNATAGDVMLTTMQCITSNELSSHNVTITGESKPQLLLSLKPETELLQSVQCTELQSRPLNMDMATSEYHLESDPGQSETPKVPSSAIDSVPSTVGDMFYYSGRHSCSQ